MMGLAKMICGVSITLTLIACSSHVQPIGKIGEQSLKEFKSALRWKQYQVAASFMEPEFREHFVKTFRGFKEDLHIADVRLIHTQKFEDGRHLEVIYEMEYFILPSVTLKTFSFDQTWVYREETENSPEGFFIVTAFPEFP